MPQQVLVEHVGRTVVATVLAHRLDGRWRVATCKARPSPGRQTGNCLRNVHSNLRAARAASWLAWVCVTSRDRILQNRSSRNLPHEILACSEAGLGWVNAYAATPRLVTL